MAATASLAALHPDSPLLSINGTLANSPFSRGFFPAFLVSAVQLGVIYGFVVGAVRSLDALVSVLVHGIRRFSAWLLLFFIISFDYACLMYIFHNI
jgi:p-aminobenzoyl-glutamate transporter AbgT